MGLAAWTWTEVAIQTGAALLVGVVGALLGWKLSESTARRVRRETHEEARADRVREIEVARCLDEALIATHRKLPLFGGLADDGTALYQAHQEWQPGWARSGVLGEQDVAARDDVVGRGS